MKRQHISDAEQALFTSLRDLQDHAAFMSAPANGLMAEKQAHKGPKAAARLDLFANWLCQAASAHLKAHCADLP
ncbi:hypothetical protein [Xylophilus sp. ASV27]|uniref:hypothetical protein n=1 Tax=Xylophilus sp. ASV27 TaxID=2795129 RepID=UPI0018EDBC6B|nr:hypothetical protein [Xylophilus sp. ASV27]